MSNKYIVFDLDDTLVYEIDYLISAFKNIAETVDAEMSDTIFEEMWTKYSAKEDVFVYLENQYPQYTKSSLLELYRNHKPNIEPAPGAIEVLTYFKSKGYKLGLISDGRSVTQRNKLEALGIEKLFDKIIISEEFGSEKPNLKNYTCFIEEDIKDYYYVADNPRKDFIAPNKLGWTTICLSASEKNIHPQSFNDFGYYAPKFVVSSLLDLTELIF